jgi:hypothetical protein
MACPAAGDPIIGFLKGALERQPARVIPFKGFLGSYSQALFRASVTWLTHPLPVPPYVRHSQEADMALQPHRLEFKPHRFEFIFAMVLAMAVTILAITTWAAPSNPDNDSAAPIPPIYQSDHRNLY